MNKHLPIKNKLAPWIALLFWFSVLQTTHAQEEINVVGNIQTILDGDLTPSLFDRTNFDFAIVGGGVVVRTFVIQNLGTSDLTINNITGTGDFSLIGALTPSSPIPAGGSASFTVTFSPTVIGQMLETITIDNSDSDENIYDFAVQGIGVVSAISTWDPLLYPPSPCSWTAQDNNATNSPFASWNLVVTAAESAGNNAVITLQPDAYLGSFNYDNSNGNESCLGHQVSATMDLNAAQNGMQILGSTSGCLTFIDLSSGSATDQWGNFTNMNGLTIKNIYLRQWGGAISLTNCTNVLIEDCVFEDVNNSAVNAVNMTGCTNVIFRRCKFLANNNNAGRALNIANSGTAGSRILLEDCEFGCNTNGGSGAALMVGDACFVQVTGGTFSGNNAGAGGRGGAVNVQPGGNVVFTNVQFMLNRSPGIGSSTDGGGAIFIDGNSTTKQTTVLIDGCNFYQNTAAGTARGGAIVCLGNSTDPTKSFTTIQNSRFEMNGADRGGALLGMHARVIINNNVFINNQSATLTNTANSAGGALSFQNVSTAIYSITNNTFTDNLSNAANRAINDAGTGATFTLTGNFLNPAAPIQTENLPINNTGGTAGSNITLGSLSSAAPNFDCSTGSYCAFTISGSCLSNNQSNFICSPSAAASGTIAGQVWNDLNGNGIQEAGDLGIGGSFVLLYDEAGYLVGRVTTDASGNYIFTGLLPGNYTVVFVNPDINSYPFMSPANASGSTESTDSDQASETIIGGELRGATSSNIAVTAGSNTTNVDAGFTNITLPIELAYFTGKKEGSKTLLQWSTAAELNNNFFNVERSNNGIEWTTISSQKGAGNSTQQNYYELYDNYPLLGVNYYRLVQFDFDGTQSISPTVAVEHLAFRNTIVYPNPASDYIMIQLESPAGNFNKIWIADMTGQEIELPFQIINDHLIKIDLSDLKSGVYCVFYDSEEQRVQQKFVKF